MQPCCMNLLQVNSNLADKVLCDIIWTRYE
jgi:hypothetical protein